MPVTREPEPEQVLRDPGDERLPRTSSVEILDPQQKPPARSARGVMGEDRREGVAEMEPPGRARREAFDRAGVAMGPRHGAGVRSAGARVKARSAPADEARR
jgi:hypothetical protein